MTKIKTAGLGYPVSKSKSPIIYGFWAQKKNVDLEYTLCEWPPEDLESGIKTLIDQGYKGFSVTLPHKQTVMALCDELDERAKAIGAVNSVVIKGGKLYGTNTDAFGFIENLKESADTKILKKPVMVLGAGGASRAVIYGLLKEGVPEIRLTNRTIEKAQTLAEFDKDRIKVIAWDDKEIAMGDIGLLVNSTSLGMSGQAPLEISLEHLNKEAAVYDIVCYPLHTDLLKEAEKRGHKIITGIGMLLHQARPSFKNWTGIYADVTSDLRDLVLK